MFVTGHSLGAALAHHALIDLIRVTSNMIFIYRMVILLIISTIMDHQE